MATLIDTLRNSHQRLIDENPVTVTISRVTRATVNGAPSKVQSAVGPFRVRVYEESGLQVSRLLTGLPGTQQVDRAYTLIAPWDADVKADPAVTDEFVTPLHGRFRLAEVYPLMYQGQVYGKRAPLERVS